MATNKSTYIRFHNDNDKDPATHKNRIDNLYSYRINIAKLLSKDGFQPTGDYARFLRLKEIDAKAEDVLDNNPDFSSPITSTISSEESKIIQDAVNSMQASEFVQLFLDSYMAPLKSDIDFRLGKVVGTKTYLYNNMGAIYPESNVYGQYDKYGRIDTTINLRLTVDIPSVRPNSGSGLNCIPATQEQYVNLFFPPYRFNSFSDTTSLNARADEFIRKRKWNRRLKKWIYDNEFDPDKVTFDTTKLLSMRKNPTYRQPAYKAINDNIMFLQYIFEQVCGIVSTYLTEWDISLYIQEGLLSGKENKAPSYLTLTNRILKDNPSGYVDTRGFVYGALNAAVSKTPIDVPVPNLSDWSPSAYPYSVYWLPYISTDRGDGLDSFYNVALKGFASVPKNAPRGDGFGFSSNTYYGLTFKEKIMRDDQLEAAFSGWLNWNTLKYWQALYTNPDDGLGSVDIVHSSIDEESSLFKDSTVTNNGEDIEVEGVITQIINALYEENDGLGFVTDSNIEEEGTEDGKKIKKIYERSKSAPFDNKLMQTIITYPDGRVEIYDASGKRMNNNNGANVVGATSSSSNSSSGMPGDLSVMGCSIPGSRILKIFLNRSSKTSNAMSIANKEKNKNYSSAKSSSNASVFNDDSKLSSNGAGVSTSPSSNSSENNGNNEAGTQDIVSMIDADQNENGKYARTDGISQWSPAIYGGPHGKSYSPKTVEGYFEENNEFYRNVPRLDCESVSSTMPTNFSGLEKRYSPKENHISGYEPYRSPSRCLSLMQRGYCDYTLQAIVCRVPHYFYSTSPEGWINGNWYWKIGQGFYWSSYGTGFLTPVQYYCKPENGDYYPDCPHIWWQSGYEWSNYYGYALSYRGVRYWRQRLNWWWFGDSDYYDNVYNLRYYKDYWGQAKRVCIHSNEKIGRYVRDSRGRLIEEYTSSRHRHYHGTVGMYQVMASELKRQYYCKYYQYETYYYRRPLMHSDPNASNESYWSINCGYENGNVFTKWYSNHWWWKYWSHFIGDLASKDSSVSSRAIALSYEPANEKFRLTFPSSRIDFRRSFLSCDDIRTTAETKFLEYVTGNSETGWHDVYFFQSDNGVSFSDRFNNGPNLVFRVPVRRNSYRARYWVWCRHRHKHRCHRDTCWHREIRYGNVTYIEVDMRNVKDVWSGLKRNGVGGVQAWSNLTSTTFAGTKQEIIMDVPPGTVGKTALPDSPYSLGGFTCWGTGVPQNWPDIGIDSNNFALHGWGFATAMPGLEYYEPNPEGIFEDPNKYLNLVNVYGESIKDKRIFDLCKQLPFYTLDNYMPLRYYIPEAEAGHPNVYTYGVKNYARIKWLDPGVISMFQYLYCTSTFFKFSEVGLEDYLKPRLVYNTNGFITLVRAVNHQNAWLKTFKNLLSTISFKEARKLIETTVNKSILAKSIPESNSYDNESVFYHYWIEKAYEIFSDESNQKNVEDEINRRLNVYQTFLNDSNKYMDKTSFEISYNTTKQMYDVVRTLKNGTVNYIDVTGRRNYVIEEFLYSYLNILYEYRKYFINKRCNKVDGTLNTMRHLEGAIPFVCENIQDLSDDLNSDSIINAGEESHTYKVSYYDIDNSNMAKIKTMIDPTSKLNSDKTMLLYIKVKYIENMSIIKNYLQRCKDGTISSEDQRYIWIPQKQKYAELPFDDTYQYISKEYLTNEAAKKFNAKSTNYEKRELNKFMDTSIFYIKWADKGGIPSLMNKRPDEKQYYRLKLGLGDKFPYVYHTSTSWKSRLNVQKNGAQIPMIKFDVQSGVDPSKLIDAQKTIQSDTTGTISPFDIICTTGSKADYWVVAIPKPNRPRAVGYVTSLKIKSYREPTKYADINNKTSTKAGVFAYSLYPITEEQANTIPGIGLDLAGVQSKMQNLYLSNYEDNVSGMNTVE